ncbi:MAG: fatty acid desaturase [Proteobacteria bacterium]|nr:fatty acid desaturase [Pseudomonadota bacterium]
MNSLSVKNLRSYIGAYTKASNSKALIVFTADMLVYVFAIAGAIYVDSTVAKILFGILAGLKIASIFAIAHDAAHDSFTSNKILNKTIARISFLPVMHNYSLWLLVHNRYHHQMPNVKGINSWSPMSPDEYNSLPLWRKKLEQFYRTPYGIWLNYLVERWWKNKFYPFKKNVGERKLIHWLDFCLASMYGVLFVSLLAYLGSTLVYTTPVELIITAFVIPVIVGSYVIGFTVYQQHTDEGIPWFKTKELCDKAGYGQEDLTMYVKFPGWYNLLSHNAMEHTVHHIDPRVPTYNLAKAQSVIVEKLGNLAVMKNFSFREFYITMKLCKLYDYDNHYWLDFNGKRTTKNLLGACEIDYAKAA